MLIEYFVQVNRKMLEVDARLLPPPQVLYANGKGAEVADGNWNLRGKRVRLFRSRRRARRSLFL
jgi:hypothetical protein